MDQTTARQYSGTDRQTDKQTDKPNLYIDILHVQLVCLLVSNKLQNDRTHRGQILWGISRDPREGLDDRVFENLQLTKLVVLI